MNFLSFLDFLEAIGDPLNLTKLLIFACEAKPARIWTLNCWRNCEFSFNVIHVLFLSTSPMILS